MTRNQKHMRNTRVISALAILVFLSCTPTISAQAAAFGMATKLPSMYNAAKNFYKGFKFGKNVYEELQNLGLVQSGSLDPPDNPIVLIYRFYTTFNIGNKQEVSAWININGAITWIENYNYLDRSPNYLCCRRESSSTNRCDTYSPTDPTQCYRSQGVYIPAADKFVFGQANEAISFEDATFIWAMSSTVVNQTATGILSFNRNLTSIYSYSLVKYFNYPGFSYYFTLTPGKSIITFNEQPDTTYNRSNFQSIQLIQNGNNQGYEDLYYVPAPQISVGNRLLQINPATDFLFGVIIDTSIPYILLAANVHSRVITELQSIIGQPVTTSDGIPMCYKNKPSWPNLTLLFPSNAQMVLNKHNYVVTDSQSDLECAAIYVSSYISVIGTMAQLDRKMIFDLNGSMLYFDQYSLQINGPSHYVGPTIATKFMMFFVMFIILY